MQSSMQSSIQSSAQSSRGVAFRASVMLACLVVIPLVAIFGKSLPEFFLGRFWQPDRPTASADGPPGFVALGSAPGEIAPAMAGPMTPGADSDRQATPARQTPIKPQAPSDLAASPVRAAGYTSLPTRAAGSTVDCFLLVESRLRQMGARHCSLETWGNDGRLYRFRCELAGGDGYARHFEATDSVPSQAMAGVLDQVESWRVGPQQTAN